MPNREQRWLTDMIAAIPDLDCHAFTDTDGHLSVKIHSPREIAERVVEFLVCELDIREEERANALSSAGMTVDTKTGVTTNHSDIRYDRRYVTAWRPA